MEETNSAPTEKDNSADNNELQHLIVTFFIPLPIPISIPHESIFSFERDEIVEWLSEYAQQPAPDSLYAILPDETAPHNFVSLKVWRPLESQPWRTEPLDIALRVAEVVTGHKPQEEQKIPKPIFSDIALTVIEAVTPLLSASDGKDQNPLSEEFDRCLEEINALIVAYFLASGETHIKRISRQNVFPIIPWATRPVGGSYSGVGGIFFANALNWAALHLAPVRDDLDKDAMQRISVLLSRTKQGDPFGNYLEWGRSARRELHITGDCAAAVMFVHTAGEILFDTILYMMAWEEGLLYDDVAQWFEQSGLTFRLKTYYHDRLGGNWRPDYPSTVLGKWTENVTKLRGRVVHAGYRPTEQEATVAVEMLGEVEYFIKERLAVKRIKYKRTALLLLGQPGLERRGLYTGQIKKFVEKESQNEAPWIASYRKWLKI